MYTFVWTSAFIRASNALTRGNAALGRKLAAVLRDLSHDPWQPHLRTHELHGKLAGMYAVRLTESYRITMTIAVTEKEIVLLDIGTHDEVYR